MTMLKTERRNEFSTHIDEMTSLEMMKVMQRENFNAAAAVGTVLPEIAKAVDEIYARMKKGGRLFYTGCGTSGRLGVLDASECPPTYGVTQNTVIGIIAGGDKAIRNSVEGAEDDAAAGKNDLAAYGITELDSVVGISVAGGAKYVIGALRYAKSLGALTVGLTCNDGCKINEICDIAVTPDTGAEVVTGSTRMKAGTAHKMILNMISTGVMIKCERVYENYMIYIKPVNQKLKCRMVRIVSDILGTDESNAALLLEKNGWDISGVLKEEHGHD